MNESTGFRPDARFRPYPEYRDSGVEWIGEVPASWKLRPLRTVAEERRDLNRGNTVTRVWSLSYGKVVERDVEKAQGLLPESFETYQILDRDNLVLRLTDLQNDKRSLRVGRVPGRGIITSAYVGLELLDAIDPRFAFYLLHSYDVTKVFYALGAGVRQTMRFADLKWMPVLCPTLSEQRVIADFLDRETEKIDALVAKKERLIELLQEKRTALITQVVTKGLNPDAPMKESGVVQLGDVPAHWRVTRLKYVVPHLTVGIVVTPAKYYVPSGVPCLRSLNISTGSIRAEDLVYIAPESNDLHRKSMLRAGDVVVVRTGLAGAAAIVPPEFDGANCIDLLIVRQSDIVASEFLHHVLNAASSRGQVREFSVGAIQAHYNTSTLGEMCIACPTRVEQEEICRHLEREMARLRRFESLVGDGIARMREYRRALVAAAVSGKIDVRDQAA